MLSISTDLVMIFLWDSENFALPHHIHVSFFLLRFLLFLAPNKTRKKYDKAKKEKTTRRLRNAIKESFTLQHGSICGVGDGKDMRRNFMAFDALIPLHDLFGVDWKLLVRIDDDAEKPWICLWSEGKVNLLMFLLFWPLAITFKETLKFKRPHLARNS